MVNNILNIGVLLGAMILVGVSADLDVGVEVGLA